MTTQKFQEQIETVTKFIQIYCDSHHKVEKSSEILKTTYKEMDFEAPYSLCKECENLLKYANARLLACPHEIKPSCRKCPHICYEKDELKFMVKVMRSSGMKLGLLKIKNLVKFK